MNAVDLIAKKRDGGELTGEEIRFFIAGVTDGRIPDYQSAAWLMAVYLQGMTHRETVDLTLAMRDSGKRIDLSGQPGGPTLDKHSTGGVGDKTTLVVVPILAAAGVPMLKMSGRGLGFSGGTVDKLESIPGFRTDLTIQEATAQVKRIGAALIAQSKELAPADGILYPLRDVTATVDCLPLIASSILSKKLAGGAQRIVLDVKVGRGAFMKTLEEARNLAEALVGIGNSAGVPTSALLTRMDEPLGTMVGNALEVQEALTILTNGEESEPRFVDLCLKLAAHGLVAVGKVQDLAEGRIVAEEKLRSGRAAEKFAALVGAQGGPRTIAEIVSRLDRAPIQVEVQAGESGMILGIDAAAIGRLAMDIGAGRATKGAQIDHSVGVELYRKTGQSVGSGELLVRLHLRDADRGRADALAEATRSAFEIGSMTGTRETQDSLVLGSM